MKIKTMNVTLNYSKTIIFKTTARVFSRQNSQFSAAYCLNLIKIHDYENFLCTLLLQDNAARSCAIAVRAFNVEVANIGSHVTQDSIGLMRLKFWDDTIAGFYVDKNSNVRVPQHPVAVELYKAIKQSKLTKRYLTNLVACRSKSLGKTSFGTVEEMEKYMEQSVSNVYYLLLEGCGVRNVNADHAASHLGRAQGIVQQLRCISLSSKVNVIPIPEDLRVKHRLSEEELMRNVESERLCNASFELAGRAYTHLTTARKLFDKIPKEGRPVLTLPAIVIDDYLERLQKATHNVLDLRLARRSLLFGPKLWWANFRTK